MNLRNIVQRLQIVIVSGVDTSLFSIGHDSLEGYNTVEHEYGLNQTNKPCEVQVYTVSETQDYKNEEAKKLFDYKVAELYYRKSQRKARGDYRRV